MKTGVELSTVKTVKTSLRTNRARTNRARGKCYRFRFSLRIASTSFARKRASIGVPPASVIVNANRAYRKILPVSVTVRGRTGRRGSCGRMETLLPVAARERAVVVVRRDALCDGHGTAESRRGFCRAVMQVRERSARSSSGDWTNATNYWCARVR